MKLTKVALAIAVLLPLGAAVAPASAATLTFDWTLTGPAAALGGVPDPGSGVLTVTTNANGADTLTSISGPIGGSAVTGLTVFEEHAEESADRLRAPRDAAPRRPLARGCVVGVAKSPRAPRLPDVVAAPHDNEYCRGDCQNHW